MVQQVCGFNGQTQFWYGYWICWNGGVFVVGMPHLVSDGITRSRSKHSEKQSVVRIGEKMSTRFLMKVGGLGFQLELWRECECESWALNDVCRLWPDLHRFEELQWIGNLQSQIGVRLLRCIRALGEVKTTHHRGEERKDRIK